MRTDTKTTFKNLELLHKEMYEGQLLCWKKEIPPLLEQYRDMNRMIENSTKSVPSYGRDKQLKQIGLIIKRLEKCLTLIESYLQDSDKTDKPDIYFYGYFKKSLEKYVNEMAKIYNGEDKGGKLTGWCNTSAEKMSEAQLNREVVFKYVILRNFVAVIELKTNIARNSIIALKKGYTKAPYSTLDVIIEKLAPLYLVGKNPERPIQEMVTLGPTAYKIKSILEEDRFDKRKVAKILGIKEEQLDKWLQGEVQIKVRPNKISQLAKFFDVTEEHLTTYFKGGNRKRHLTTRAPLQKMSNAERISLEKARELEDHLYYKIHLSYYEDGIEKTEYKTVTGRTRDGKEWEALFPYRKVRQYTDMSPTYRMRLKSVLMRIKSKIDRDLEKLEQIEEHEATKEYIYLEAKEEDTK